MHKLYFSFILTFIFVLHTGAQSKLPKKAIGKPRAFVNPVENYNLETFRATSAWWRVFSDRANNPVYDEPNGSVVDYIDFLESFVVAEYKKGWLHIVKTTSVEWPYLKETDKDYGWIREENMLLWENSLELEGSHIVRKAMIVVSKANIDARKEGEKNTFFIDPTHKDTNAIEPSIFQIFYIYKIDLYNQSILLGDATRLSGADEVVRKQISGWLPFDKVSFWDHRQCLEPNFQADAISERKNTGIEASIFESQEQVLNYRMSINDPTMEDIWTSKYEVRMPGNHIRFPIMKRKGNLFNVGYVGKWGDDCPCNDPELTARKKEIVDKRENIHFIFVVDGTVSMKEYYKDISASIDELLGKMARENSRMKVRLSTVIYGNTTDTYGTQRRRRMDRVEFNDFLRNVELAEDKGGSKAVYQGLREALTVTGIDKKETNFIVLIGDKWDDSSEKTEGVRNDIINWMVEYKTNFISFQVYNNGTKSFRDFFKGSYQILKQTADRIYETEATTNSIKPVLNEIEGGYKLNDQPIVGSFLFARKGSALTSELLKSEITSRLVDFEEELSVALLDVERLMRGEKTDYLSPKARSILNELTSEDVIEDLSAGCTGVIMPGWTTYTLDGLNHPLFSESVFMTRQELNQFVDLFSGFVNSMKREGMKKAWEQLLDDVIGEKWKGKMTFDEAYKRLVGIPCPNDFLANKRIKDITSRTAISDEEFQRWNLALYTRVTNLQQSVLKDPNYEGKYEYNNEEYFWVPMSMFP